MLLEFRVKNFKSIRDEVVFSLNASKDSTLEKTHTLQTGIKLIPNVVCSAAIYGANASGKSNLLEAIKYMRGVVNESASLQIGQTFNVKNFALDSLKCNEPTEFEITFINEGIRYQYGFALSTERIVEEWLYEYKTSKPTHLFSRRYDNELKEDLFDLGSGLKGQKAVWQKATKENSLYLSTAVQLNSEQLKPVFIWITQNIIYFGNAGLLPINKTVDMVNDGQYKHDIINFLSTADICIDDITVKEVEAITHEFKFNDSTNEAEANRKKVNRLLPEFHHVTEHGSAIFDLNEESTGTQRLFALAGPILNILKEGKILIFDELDSSLHTLLAKKIVEMFHEPELNTKGSQLIFSTHDTELLRNNLLRRDQVWFIDKNSSQVTNLYPLTDFSPRKSEDLESGYLIGRYGAIPFIENFKLDPECNHGS